MYYLQTEAPTHYAGATQIILMLKFQFKTTVSNILFEEIHACIEIVQFQEKKMLCQCLSDEFLMVVKCTKNCKSTVSNPDETTEGWAAQSKGQPGWLSEDPLRTQIHPGQWNSSKVTFGFFSWPSYPSVLGSLPDAPGDPPFCSTSVLPVFSANTIYLFFVSLVHIFLWLTPSCTSPFLLLLPCLGLSCVEVYWLSCQFQLLSYSFVLAWFGLESFSGMWYLNQNDGQDQTWLHIFYIYSWWDKICESPSERRGKNP